MVDAEGRETAGSTDGWHMTFVERIEGDAGTLDVAEDRAPAATDFDMGGDERRMHVRAYNHWVSLLKGRPFPTIADLDPASIADFGPHSVLLDFSEGLGDPAIAYLGGRLRAECDLDPAIDRVRAVPGRSLLSRLTDHYLQIIANRAPIGFEAEFVGTRGRTMVYRGILMPFSSDGAAIDFIYGVINWKEVADALVQATLDSELAAALRHEPPVVVAHAPVWADGPSAREDDVPETLADRLALARETALAVQAADTRSRTALYRALGQAHDFALAAREDAEGYAGILEDAGITVQPRAPMTPLVKLVFGTDYDKTRLAEYAAVLGHAARREIGAGALPAFLDAHEGGIKAVVAAERAARRPMPAADPRIRAADALRQSPALATVAIDTGEAEFVVLVARARGDGRVDIVANIAAPALVDAALRHAA